MAKRNMGDRPDQRKVRDFKTRVRPYHVEKTRFGCLRLLEFIPIQSGNQQNIEFELEKSN